MKFIHLADLHLGKRVNGFSMIEDQRHILEQILCHVEDRRPRAVVIAGDIYDKPVPGVEAVRLLDGFLTALSQKGVAVLLIGGNHDSPERLEFGGGIMAGQNIHLCGGYEGSLRKVTLLDEYGPLDFYLLPFLRPVFVRRFFAGERVESYPDALGLVLACADLDPQARNVLVAHQFFTAAGVDPVLSESEIGPVGGLDCIDIGLLPAFDYVALGHLHGPQRVGADHIRYAGSPLKYSASEHRHIKSVPLVTLDRKGGAEIELLPLNPRRDLRKIRGPLDMLLRAEVAGQGNGEDYIHCTLTDEEELVDALGKVRSVYPNLMALEFENARTAAAVMPQDAPDTDLSPDRLFGDFYESRNGVPLGPAGEGTVRRLMEEEALL